MSDEFNFAPAPRITPKKRKRSQTAPLIASIVTPAVVMIGFLVYLDRKGFFSPPAAPAKAQAKTAADKPRIEKASKHFPDPQAVKREVPPWGPLVDNRRPQQAVVPNQADPLPAEPMEPLRPAPKRTGPLLPAEWEIELPSKEILRSKDLRVTRSQIADQLAKADAVWVYVDRGAPAVCFALGSRKARTIGLNEPVFHGVALAIGDSRRPALAVEYQLHKRTGWFRLFSKEGDTEALVHFVNGQRRGVACLCEDRQPVYIHDVQGKTAREYFVAVDGDEVQGVAVDRADAKQMDRAGEFKRRLLELEADLDESERAWRLPFTVWDDRCTKEITAAALAGKEAGEKKISDLRAEQYRLRDSLLGGR